MSRTAATRWLAAIVGGIWLLPAVLTNVASMALTRRLARADVFLAPVPRLPHDQAIESSSPRPQWLRSSRIGPVWAAWDALLRGDTNGAATAVVDAVQIGSGFGRSLDAFARSSRRRAPGPTGLAEYEYGLALAAIHEQDWSSGLRLLERAVRQRPGPWPQQFADAYASALERVTPKIAAQIAAEQSIADTSLPRISVGRKDSPGWQVPVHVEGDSYLLGFTLRSWTALERGLPLTVDLFWKEGSGRTTPQTIRTWNMVPNGGFEIDATRPEDFGWFETNLSGESVVPTRRDVQHGGRTVHLVVTPPTGPESSSDIVTALVAVRPARLLWHAWVEQSDGGNPVIFVTWYDRHGTRLRDELPLQGQVARPGRSYAGVLSVPQDAHYLSVRLSNWKAAAETRWADFLLIELPPSA